MNLVEVWVHGGPRGPGPEPPSELVGRGRDRPLSLVIAQPPLAYPQWWGSHPLLGQPRLPEDSPNH